MSVSPISMSHLPYHPLPTPIISTLHHLRNIFWHQPEVAQFVISVISLPSPPLNTTCQSKQTAVLFLCTSCSGGSRGGVQVSTSLFSMSLFPPPSPPQSHHKYTWETFFDINRKLYISSIQSTLYPLLPPLNTTCHSHKTAVYFSGFQSTKFILRTLNWDCDIAGVFPASARPFIG